MLHAAKLLVSITKITDGYQIHHQGEGRAGKYRFSEKSRQYNRLLNIKTVSMLDVLKHTV
jgi:hypothetical protein